jgi:hypothetical protein
VNPGKIYAMVIWALKVQQLPLPVLVREKRTITSTVQYMITLEFGGDIVKLEVFQGLIAPYRFVYSRTSRFINTLFIVLLNNIAIFVDDFLVLIPFVLDHLTFGSLAIRCNY